MIKDKTLLQKLAVGPNATLGEAVRTVNEGGYGLAVVQDEHGKFLGILADGDIRRAILGGINLETLLTNLYQKNPVTAAAGATGEMCSEIMRKCLLKYFIQSLFFRSLIRCSFTVGRKCFRILIEIK